MLVLSPDQTAFLFTALVSLMVIAALLWAVPSCGDPACTAAHQKHRITTLSANIEKTHVTFHSKDRPQATCALCQQWKREDDGAA